MAGLFCLLSFTTDRIKAGNLLIVRTGLASWTRCLRTAAGHWSEPRANDVSSL